MIAKICILPERKVSVSKMKAVIPSPLTRGIFHADVYVMASALAYENKKVIKDRINDLWKMRFVKFFDQFNVSTQAFMFCDTEVDAQLVVIAFRGTELFNTTDWKTDADIEPLKLRKSGTVHYGFMEALRVQKFDRKHKRKSSFYLDIVEELKKLLEAHKNAKFLVTGHSLGGALAVVFSALMFLHQDEQITERLVAVYTFGQPRVGDEKFGNFMASTLNKPGQRYFRVVYSNDLIARVPLGMCGFKHFGTCLYYNKFFQLTNLQEEPRIWSPRNLISARVNVIWDIVVSISMLVFSNRDYQHHIPNILPKAVIGPISPEMVSHCLSNYIDCVRLDPPLLGPGN